MRPTFITVLVACVLLVLASPVRGVLASPVRGLHAASHRRVALRRSSGLVMTTVLFKPSGKSVEIEGGSKLSLAAYRAGVAIAFNCRMGSCAVCEVKMNGKKVKTCVTDVPKSGKVTVITPQ